MPCPTHLSPIYTFLASQPSSSCLSNFWPKPFNKAQMGLFFSGNVFSAWPGGDRIVTHGQMGRWVILFDWSMKGHQHHFWSPWTQIPLASCWYKRAACPQCVETVALKLDPPLRHHVHQKTVAINLLSSSETSSCRFPPQHWSYHYLRSGFCSAGASGSSVVGKGVT